MSTLITIKFSNPPRRISEKKLRELVAADSWNAIKTLEGGGFAAIIGELGFMAVRYSVVTYRPGRLFRSKLVLGSVLITEEADYAQERFAEHG